MDNDSLDCLQRFIFESASVRGEVVRLQKTYQTISHQHPYPHAIRKFLGEALAAACLLCGILKFEGRLSLQFQGKNKLKLLLIQCDHVLNIRGLVQCDPQLTEDDLMQALQHGTLAITIDSLGSTNQRYQGIVEWQGTTLAAAIEGYFKQSEQLETRVWLEVNETQAVGILLQVIPSANEEARQQELAHLTHLTQTITPKELFILDNETLLYRLYSQEKVRIFTPNAIQFKCNCSVPRGEQAILLLGKEEAEAELNEHQCIVVTCDFCNSEFTFMRDEIDKIFRNNDGHQIH